jgi:ribosome-associated protein
MSTVTNKNTFIEDKDIIVLIKECKAFLDEKKAENIIALDLHKIHSYLDYFVLCTANSRLHCRSLAREVIRFLEGTPLKLRKNPDMDSEWIILDYSAVVIHIFTQEYREYYNLERLWADAAYV